MKSRVFKIWTQLQWKDRTWWQRPHAKCNWAKSPLPLACYWSELASAPREDTTRVNRCLPKSSSRKVYCYWHQKFAQPPWYGYIREVDGAECPAVAELNCPRTCPPCLSSSMFFLQWWTCEPEASEACCETEMSTPESNEASMLLEGTIQDYKAFWEVFKCWPRSGAWDLPWKRPGVRSSSGWWNWDWGNEVFGLSRRNRDNSDRFLME